MQLKIFKGSDGWSNPSSEMAIKSAEDAFRKWRESREDIVIHIIRHVAVTINKHHSHGIEALISVWYD